MKRFIYTGDHNDLKGEHALGREVDGKFCVQVDGIGTGDRKVPLCLVDGKDWAHGWHETPAEDWVEILGTTGNLLTVASMVVTFTDQGYSDVDAVFADDLWYIVGRKGVTQ